MKKIYAAKGLLEWQGVFRAGGVELRLLFTGGSMGSNGVIAAKYSTDNVAIQRIIESSEHYKNGKIVVYGNYPPEKHSR